MSQTRARGWSHNAQIVLYADRFDIDISVRTGVPGLHEIIGQVLENGASDFSAPSEVQLLKHAMPIARTLSDPGNEFRFSSVPKGPLNILVVIPQSLTRIFGTFSI
jgi:hypothetical protein